MAESKKARRGMSLSEAAREFWRHPTPWLLSTALVAAVVARIAVGDWQYSDAVLPFIVLAVFPFFEWMIHVVILHWRPRRIAGIVIDPLLARKHREHHIDPRIIKLIFIPLQSLFGALASGLLVALLLFPRTGLGLSFLVVLLTIGIVYEWTHYLVHTDYKAKTALYRFIWRNHRQHHYKNENYWFAVTAPGVADRVLGTYPDPQSVPTSPTSRNLHGAGSAAKKSAQVAN